MHKQSTSRFLLTLSLEVSLVYEARFLSPGDAGRYYTRHERPCFTGLTSKLLFCRQWACTDLAALVPHSYSYTGNKGYSSSFQAQLPTIISYADVFIGCFS
jgi:hypothetical protein